VIEIFFPLFQRGIEGDLQKGGLGITTLFKKKSKLSSYIMISISTWKTRAKRLKTELYALYYAFKDPRVPFFVKLFLALIIGYALSPIDLIPDFIPILGYLDDLILIPAGIALAIRMIPKGVLEECREKAGAEVHGSKPRSWIAAIIIVIVWLFIFYLVLRFVIQLFK
jgi:uncharacterized membrane protein YkvA (DUF1232 family)